SLSYCGIDHTQSLAVNRLRMDARIHVPHVLHRPVEPLLLLGRGYPVPLGDNGIPGPGLVFHRAIGFSMVLMEEFPITVDHINMVGSRVLLQMVRDVRAIAVELVMEVGVYPPA